MRLLHKHTPFLFKKCIGNNFHWKWDRICSCCYGEHFEGFHGGVYDMKLHREYQLCEHCKIEEKAIYLISPSIIMHNKGNIERF